MVGDGDDLECGHGMDNVHAEEAGVMDIIDLVIEADKLDAGLGLVEYAEDNVGGPLTPCIGHCEDVLDEIVAPGLFAVGGP
jgi:hypothetical protein